MPAVNASLYFNPMHMDKKAQRKVLKPKIEKKRRDRINSSMEELKIIVLHGLNKDPSLYSKLEKADILEMTVKYMRNVSSGAQLACSDRYRAGFSECAGAVSHYMATVDSSLQGRMMNHLSAVAASRMKPEAQPPMKTVVQQQQEPMTRYQQTMISPPIKKELPVWRPW
ncbi:PREDICTED: transcription factor HES-1-like [Priapulus caudatus]|uniref:Transcription factor HES-1-like n=1 Tax=Priapulus caudatus TaxID=37621 RepID=A0ABM1EU02_PRICU|nr:PREDICTED: transcription factor HES-1-like [Priapulus caudatus]